MTGTGVWGLDIIPLCQGTTSDFEVEVWGPSPMAMPENREMKTWKMKFSFFRQRHALSTSFDIFVVTYRVTNFLPKLINMLLFSTKKTEFPFFEFPIFGCCRPLLWPESWIHASLVCVLNVDQLAIDVWKFHWVMFSQYSWGFVVVYWIIGSLVMSR